MQLHPNFPGKSTDHTIHSLSAGYVGLDFKVDVGDLLRADYDSLPQEEKVQWAFAHEMAIGDKVLVFVHHYPFALATVCGEYNSSAIQSQNSVCGSDTSEQSTTFATSVTFAPMRPDGSESR